MLNKVNDWLDSPWSIRRSIKWTAAAMAIYGAIAAVCYVKEYTWLFENVAYMAKEPIEKKK